MPDEENFEENGIDQPIRRVGDDIPEDEGKKPNKGFIALIGIIVAIIWLAVIAVLIKLDVGGFGSQVLAPVLKDVPVISKILPDTTDQEIIQGHEYPYKSLAEAIEYIKVLEDEIATMQSRTTVDEDTIAELKSEVERLKNFETNQLEYQAVREQFYKEVVFGDKAADYENFMEYYESIEPEIAERIYKEAAEKYLIDEQYATFAETFSTMAPESAASIFAEMTGDLDTVVGILNSIETDARASIMEALADINPVFAAKVTQLLVP